MNKSAFKSRLMSMVSGVLNDQFDEDETMTFSDFWETVRDHVDTAADDEDIGGHAADEEEEGDELEPLDLG